jgi:glycine cleavage system H lipoate-binding protein
VFPGIYEFSWDAGHIIFLGIFYSVVVVVASTVIIAMLRAIRGFSHRRAEAVRWHLDFEDLPPKARACRHELSGEVAERTCPNHFDCRHCEAHPKFVAAQPPAAAIDPAAVLNVAGFQLPADRLYHRGHTWVRTESDGTLAIGLDDLGAHLIGNPDSTELPAPGEHLLANGTAWRVEKKGVSVRVLSPVDGEVLAVGGVDDPWVLKVKADPQGADLRHLLTVAEARPWMLREVERLQMSLATDGVGPALADGGMPIDDFTSAIPAEQLDEVCGLMFLEP